MLTDTDKLNKSIISSDNLYDTNKLCIPTYEEEQVDGVVRFYQLCGRAA